MHHVQAAIQQCDSKPELKAHLQTVFPEHDGRTQWDQCSYPNPRVDFEQCGLKTSGWICDPDGILRPDQIDELRDDIKDVLAASDCRCEDGCIKDAHGHPVMVLVMDWIRIGNLNIDGGYCEHTDEEGCELRFPQLEPGSRDITEHEWQSAFRLFGDHISKNWDIGACKDEVLLIVSRQYNRLVVHTGEFAKEVIGEEAIAEAEEAAKRNLALGSVKTGIENALAVLKTKLAPKSNAPFYVGMTFLVILIILIIAFVLFIVIFCACALYVGKSCGDACSDFGEGDFSVLKGENKKLIERKENGPEEGSPLKEDGINSSPQRATEINNSTSPV